MLNLGAQVNQFKRSTDPEERLKLLRYIGQEANLLRTDILKELVVSAIRDEDPRLRGEICYALGEAGMPEFLPVLEVALADPNEWVSSQAKSAIQKLESLPPNASHVSNDNVGSVAAEILTELLRSIITAPTSHKASYNKEIKEEFEQNQRAFERDEPKLLEKHKDEIAVYCDGRLIAINCNEAQAIEDAIRLKSNRRLYVRKIGEELPKLGINIPSTSQESL